MPGAMLHRARRMFALSMLLSLSMQSTQSAAATAAKVVDSDAVVCPYSKTDDSVGVSNEIFDAWFNKLPYNGNEVRIQSTSTAVSDRIAVDLSRGVNFVGHVGGGGGSRAEYDSHRKVLIACQVYDTAQAVFIIGRVGKPPFSVGAVDARRVHTARGIALGSTLSKVMRVYGKGRVVNAGSGRLFICYERTLPLRGSSLPYTISTTFGIARGHVISIERETGV